MQSWISIDADRFSGAVSESDCCKNCTATGALIVSAGLLASSATTLDKTVQKRANVKCFFIIENVKKFYKR
jgi:hypothetical protein